MLLIDHVLCLLWRHAIPTVTNFVLSLCLLQPKELDRSQDTAVREGAHHHR